LNRQEQGLDYLNKYPKLNKWINRCVCCGGIGYSSKLPTVITTKLGKEECDTVAAQNIRRYFQPMDVNEMGVCETCQKFM